MSFFLSPLWCCILGGIAVEFLKFIDFNKPGISKPDYKSWGYYFSIILSIGLSAIVGFIYFYEQDIPYNKALFFHTGATAPLLVKSLMANATNKKKLKRGSSTIV